MVNRLKSVIAVYNDFTLFHKYENGVLGPGTNIRMRNIKSIFKHTMLEKNQSFMSFKSIIPENILSFDPIDGNVMFYTKPEMQTLFFSKDLNLDVKPTDKFKMPFLLWNYKNENLQIFALKRKPTKDTDDLYNAPFMNVSSNGSVCMGNVKYGQETKYFEDLIDDIVFKFYNSIFTHTNNNNLLTINYLHFLKKYKNDKNVSYANLLVKSNYKIHHLL